MCCLLTLLYLLYHVRHHLCMVFCWKDFYYNKKLVSEHVYTSFILLNRFHFYEKFFRGRKFCKNHSSFSTTKLTKCIHHMLLLTNRSSYLQFYKYSQFFINNKLAATLFILQISLLHIAILRCILRI